MIRQRIIANLREFAISLGQMAEGTQWHLFGSVDRDEPDAADIDLMILCTGDDQADTLRRAIDPDAFLLPLHLALMTFDEAAEIDAVSTQHSSTIFP
ncbi:hypothetical protein [Chromobacterium paludis]|uniref:Nucleotidyltransferase domain-containing protein n=1 Tax=Chromobacterium paludis TaxID=2605945 RepID=A0A5C1DEI9_9NEIS|nr:hypothetical protein [Chromobacterium paludis]QEL55185.1 hypothetical protein FYK34_06205 [Chromobacterium paludis]